jgi:hypothetical protein
LSGKKIAATSTDILFKDVKAAARKEGVTINDFITSCMATGVKQYFELKGDKKTNKLNIVLPANIRFQHYGSWEKVKFENKFAPVPLVIPIDSDNKKSMQLVAPETAQLRSQFIDVYATYAGTYYFCMFAPYYIQNWFLMYSTTPYTLAFSNTPGILKPLIFENKKSIKM